MHIILLDKGITWNGYKQGRVQRDTAPSVFWI